MTENKPEGDKTRTFSIEVDHAQAESGEMPSVTRLLNRKSLKLKSSQNKQTPASSPANPSASSKDQQSPYFAPSPAPAVLQEAQTAPLSQNPSTPSIRLEFDSPSPADGRPAPSQPFEIKTDFSKTAPIDSPPSQKESSFSSPGITLASEPSGSFELETSGGNTTQPAEASPFENLPPQSTPEPSTALPAMSQEKTQPIAQKTEDAPDISQPIGSLTIQPSARKRPAAAEPLIHWTIRELVAGKDPLGKAVGVLLQKGAHQGLFLNISNPSGNSKVPVFKSMAAIHARDKEAFWNGLIWDPTVVPDLWNFLVRAGVIELSPPGASTYQKSNRNVVRAAFGIPQEEWLLLLRVGPASACRGILAMVTKGSLITELTEVIPLIQSTVAKKKAS